MRQSSFSVLIPQGQETGGGFVRLPHNTRYTLRLGNHDNRCCDAEVKIDGKVIDFFRLNNGCTVEVEGPPDDLSKGCFTFFRAASEEAADAGAASIGREERGVIEVTFKPGKVVRPVISLEGLGRNCTPPATWRPAVTKRWPGVQPPDGGILRAQKCMAGPDAYSGVHAMGFTASHETPPPDVESGVTGLTGTNAQTWQKVANLDYDPTAEVAITLRLVADKAVRPLTAKPQGNPRPVAVE
jgi:hypothetical protein